MWQLQPWRQGLQWDGWGLETLVDIVLEGSGLLVLADSGSQMNTMMTSEFVQAHGVILVLPLDKLVDYPLHLVGLGSQHTCPLGFVIVRLQVKGGGRAWWGCGVPSCPKWIIIFQKSSIGDRHLHAGVHNKFNQGEWVGLNFNTLGYGLPGTAVVMMYHGRWIIHRWSIGRSGHAYDGRSGWSCGIERKCMCGLIPDWDSERKSSKSACTSYPHNDCAS